MQRSHAILNINCQNFRSVELLFIHVWAWAPKGMCILVQDHSRVLCEQLQQLMAEDTNQPRGPRNRLRGSPHQHSQGGHGRSSFANRMSGRQSASNSRTLGRG